MCKPIQNDKKAIVHELFGQPTYMYKLFLFLKKP